MHKITMAAMWAAAASLVAVASPTYAQSAADGDVRCFMLSNVFAKQASDEKARAAAATSLAFYLGRLDGRASAAVIAASVRRQGPAIDPKTAGAQMTACAARVGRLEQSIQAAVRAGAPAK